MTARARTADPYTDLLVIDANAPRFNQLVVATVSGLAVATGSWVLLGLMGLQLAITVRFGRKYCLPCLAYFELIQPRLGEGPLEDSRAPRFANIIGAVFLLSGAALWAAGFPVAGQVLGLIVAALAGLATTTGLCVGCELYRLLARFRGIRGGAIERIDLEQLASTPSDGAVVLFTHPLCSDCQTLEPRLKEKGHEVITVDVSRRKDLARKYGVSLVPLAVQVGADGQVRARLA